MSDSSSSSARGGLHSPGFHVSTDFTALTAELWSVIQMLTLAPAVVLVADAIWGFWTPPVVFTRIASLWTIFFLVNFGSCFLFVLSGTKAKRYKLAAEVAKGMIIGCEVNGPMVEPLLALRIKMASGGHPQVPDSGKSMYT